MSVLDEIYNKQKITTDRLIGEFEGELSDVLIRINRLSIARLSSISQDNILQFNLVWQEILQDAGYYNLVNGYLSNSFDSFYEDTLKAFESAGITTAWTIEDAAAFDTLKQMKSSFFIGLGDDAGKAVQRELSRYVLAGASLDDITAGIERSIEDINLKRYARTYARTSIGEYQQEIIDVRSASIEEGVWIYVGVNDGKTRPFCKHVLKENSCYNDSEKLRLQNDPDREFNCRHQFFKVSKQYAQNEGYSCQ